MTTCSCSSCHSIEDWILIPSISCQNLHYLGCICASIGSLCTNPVVYNTCNRRNRDSRSRPLAFDVGNSDGQRSLRIKIVSMHDSHTVLEADPTFSS